MEIENLVRAGLIAIGLAVARLGRPRMRNDRTTAWGIAGAIGFVVYALSTTFGAEVDAPGLTKLVELIAAAVAAFGLGGVGVSAKDAPK